MIDREINDLSAAISLMLEQLRPSSMQARVLEAMVNKAPNGLPRMTYDLEYSNAKYAEMDIDFQVPTIWELIGLDVAPYPGLWQKVEYARDNAKAIRNAVYNLKEQFESLGEYQDEDGNPTGVPISLFVFNKNGPKSRDINVVTPDPVYCNSMELSVGKEHKGIHGRVMATAKRARVNGKDHRLIIRELATTLKDASAKADLPKMEQAMSNLLTDG